MTQLAVLDQITAVPFACQIGRHNFATNSTDYQLRLIPDYSATQVLAMLCSVTIPISTSTSTLSPLSIHPYIISTTSPINASY